MADHSFAHNLAKLRQLGVGVWRILFIVIGYDAEEFIMYARGDLTKKIAEATTRMQLARALKVAARFVEHKSTHHEAP